jgi:intracellular multiplication protein IcmT
MAQWRETYKPARFFMLDARAGIPLLLTALHMRPWTIGVTLGINVLFWFLERRGLTVPSAMRAFRAWIVGDLRPPLPNHKIRGTIDYERRLKSEGEYALFERMLEQQKAGLSPEVQAAIDRLTDERPAPPRRQKNQRQRA